MYNNINSPMQCAFYRSIEYLSMNIVIIIHSTYIILYCCSLIIFKLYNIKILFSQVNTIYCSFDDVLDYILISHVKLILNFIICFIYKLILFYYSKKHHFLKSGDTKKNIEIRVLYLFYRREPNILNIYIINITLTFTILIVKRKNII